MKLEQYQFQVKEINSFVEEGRVIEASSMYSAAEKFCELCESIAVGDDHQEYYEVEVTDWVGQKKLFRVFVEWNPECYAEELLPNSA